MRELACRQEEDLIGFLYGELDEVAKIRFTNHLESCAECKTQLATFNNVRGSVVAWRNESLGTLTSPVERPPMVVDQSNRSALRALREFFDLTPLWAKGTLAFASLLFCLLAVLALARFNQTAPVNHVAAGNDSKTEQKLNAEVERRVKEELQRREAQQLQATVTETPAERDLLPRVVNKSKRVARSIPSSKIARPLSKLERQELAADLRLIEDDAGLDLILIGDRINQ